MIAGLTVVALCVGVVVLVCAWVLARPVDWPGPLTAPPSRVDLIGFVMPHHDSTYAQLLAVAMIADGRRQVGYIVAVEQAWHHLACIVGDGFDLGLVAEVMRRARPGMARCDVDAIASVARDVTVGKLAATLDVPPELLVGPTGDAVSAALRSP